MAYYRSYKGRRGGGNKLLIVLACLFLLLVLAIVVYFFAQEYIVFTSEGFSFRFPWTKQEEIDVPEDNISLDDILPDDVPLDIVGGDDSLGSSGEPDDGRIPSGNTCALYGDIQQFSAPDYLSSLTLDFGSTGFNAIAAEVKNRDGVWFIPSSSEYANTFGNAEDIGKAASAFDEYRKVAVASAFRDDVLPRNAKDLAICTQSGATWLDYKYTSWIDPFSDGAADYLMALVDACQQSGFDELVLDNFQFPTSGKTELIVYDRTDKVEALSGLAEEISRYAEEKGVLLSVVLTDKAALSGSDEAAGQDVSLLSKSVSRFYSRTEIAFSPELLGQAQVGYFISDGSEIPDDGSFIVQQ